MSERPVIADTGPIVSFLIEREPRHSWAVAQFKLLPAPFLTCEPVLTEVFHFLSRVHNGPRRLFELLARGVFVLDFDLAAQVQTLEKLVDNYQDIPMSLADACLVRMAEMHPNAVVLTFDNHFTTYRKNGRQPIPILAPEQ